MMTSWSFQHSSALIIVRDIRYTAAYSEDCARLNCAVIVF